MHLPSADFDNAYDDLPYGSNWRSALSPSVFAANPDRAAWNVGHGEHLPRVVCDLACGSGRQVLQGALLHPDIEFVGVDGSHGHILEANRLKDSLALTNVEFICADLMDWSPEAARYDLMTCSGTYPWVPDAVRERILQTFERGLAADGLAILHILSLPACVGVVEAQRRLLDAVGSAGTITQRLEAAKAYVAALPPAAPKTPDASPDSGRNVINNIVRSQLRQILERNDPGVAHEFLGGPVRADYFRDFEASAKRYGLHAVGDANPTVACDRLIPAGPLRELFERTRSWHARQELLDMFAGTSGGRDVVLARSPRLAVQSAPRDGRPSLLHARSSGVFDEASCGPSELRWHRGDVLTVSSSQAALWNRIHAAAPESVCIEPRERDDADFLAVHGYTELAIVPTAIAALHGAAPTTTPLARAEVSLHLRELSSPLGYHLPNVPAVALVLQIADGSLDSAALAEASRGQWAARASADQSSVGDRAAEQAWAQWWPSERSGQAAATPPMDNVDFTRLIDRLAHLGYFN